MPPCPKPHLPQLHGHEKTACRNRAPSDYHIRCLDCGCWRPVAREAWPMAKNDSESEQKSLPASEKKLRDGRKKGQVSSSRDLISGFGLLIMIAYLLFAWPSIRDQTVQLVDLVSRAIAEPPGSA